MEKYFPRQLKMPSVGSHSPTTHVTPTPSEAPNVVASVDDVVDDVALDVLDTDVEGVHCDAADFDDDDELRDDARSAKKARIESTSVQVIISDPGLRIPINKYEPLIRDDMRRQYVSKGPCQPLSHNFPRTVSGKKTRGFVKTWFSEWEWIEYSVSKDAAFCFWCYLFKCECKKFLNDAFTNANAGYSNWKKGPEAFREHEGSNTGPHNDSRLSFLAFKNQKQSVSRCLSVATQSMRVKYRTRLTIALIACRYLLGQGLPFRGHRESGEALNKGNFIAFVDCFNAYIAELRQGMKENAPGNLKLTSHGIQSDLVAACASLTRKAIISDIGGKCFALLVDESRDCSIKEQMGIVVRYVDNFGALVERFLGVVHVTDTKAVTLKRAIDEFFAEHGLSLTQLRGQGYDGASNMRGEVSGLKTLILAENPSAKYVHCFAHQLQLVVVTVSQDNQWVNDFFSLLAMISNMAGNSCKRKDEFRQKQHEEMVSKLEKGDIVSGK